MSRFDAIESGRPLWLVTLADLCLLLVGFFVFVQASALDGATLAAAIRDGFDAPAQPAPVAQPIALDRADVRGFAVGSADLPADATRRIAWVRQASADPRTVLRITGHSDGSAQDRDAATGSAALLASDRARSVAAMLVRAGAVPGERIAIATGTAGAGRHVTLSIAFAGDPQRQCLAAPAMPGCRPAPSDRSQP